MNGKKAKLLRGLAGVSKEDTREYQVDKKTIRTYKMMNPGTNEVVGTFSTAGTFHLKPCARSLYKLLKRGYYQRNLSSAVA